jgi:hypothetical protein
MSHKTEVLDLFVFVEVADDYGNAFMATTPSPFTYAFGQSLACLDWSGKMPRGMHAKYFFRVP